jgi:RHS repeat-associated protein
LRSDLYSDDENQLLPSTQRRDYDAEGNRAGKSGSGATDTVYFGGNPVARYAGGEWTDLVYGAGGILAEAPQTGSVYRMTDHLGSGVGTLSSTGAVLGIQDYAPFGQLFNGANTNDPYKFTGKERDTESGNDYFGARYYSSSMGRFLSPDPSGLSRRRGTQMDSRSRVAADCEVYAELVVSPD